MLKSLLNKFLNIHHHHLQNSSEIYDDLFHYASKKRSFCESMYGLNHAPNKLKYSLILLSRMNGNHLYLLMGFVTCSYLTYYRKSIEEAYKYQLLRFQGKEEKKEQPSKPPITGSRIVINEVLQKQQINTMLGELIVRIDNKQSTQHNIAKQLQKLGNITFLYNKTFILTRDLLIQQVFNNEDIQIKLRDLLIRVMKDQKHQIVGIFSDQLRNNIVNAAVFQLANLYNSEGFQQGLANALIGGLYGYLDDKKTVIELLKLLQSE